MKRPSIILQDPGWPLYHPIKFGSIKLNCRFCGISFGFGGELTIDWGVDANGVVEAMVVKRKARLLAVRMSKAVFKVCMMGGKFNAINNLLVVGNRAEIGKVESSG